MADARQMIKSPAKLQGLVAQTVRKLANTSGDKLTQMREQLGLASSLLAAWLAGDYQDVANKTIISIVAALLYFVVPLDVVPDFIFAWGLLDDAAVLSYVFTQLNQELAAFSQWQLDRAQSDDDHEGSGK